MNNIWHITNKNKDTTDIPEEGNMVVLDGIMGYSCLWYDYEESIIFWENVKRWCYLDDLIACEDKLKRYSAALELIKNLSGAGMSYQDMVIECREIAKLAFDPDYNAILMGRYDEYSHKLFDILRTKGGNNVSE